MATISSLASKYDPSSPTYDPTAAPQPALAATTSNPAPVNATAFDPIASAKALTDANKVAPTLGTFDESKGVAGRVNTLVGQDNPLMQTARTQAAQESQRRGIVNSSLGVQAGEQAVINTATPIASADAQLNQQQNLTNQNASNAASTTNAQLGVNAGVQGISLAQQAKQFDVTSGQSQQQIDSQRAQFAQNLSLQTRQVDTQISQFAQTLGLTVQDLQIKRDSLTAQQQQQLDQLNLQKTQLAQQQGQFSASQAQQANQFSTQQQQQLVMQGLDQQNKLAVAGIEAQFKAQIQSSVNVAGAWQTMMQGISAIQTNAGLDSAAKQQLIANTTAGFASFANFWKKTSNIDVGDLLAFNVANAPGSVDAPASGQAAPYPRNGGFMPGNFEDGTIGRGA